MFNSFKNFISQLHNLKKISSNNSRISEIERTKGKPLIEKSDNLFKEVKNTTGHLINNTYKGHPKRLFIIGAGAQKNSWNPLFDCYGYPDESFDSQLFIIQLLARSVSIAKHNYALIIAEIDKNPDPCFKEIYNTRKLIGDLFLNNNAMSEIQLRELPKILDLTDKLQDDDSFIINLNWDTTISRKFPTKNLIHLHGKVNYPETIILPTESTNEKYRPYESYFHKTKCNADFELAKAHMLAFSWFLEAEEIYMWGVNINEYDFEVNHFLKSYDQKKWFTINPSKKPANLLSYINDTIVHHINPYTTETSNIHICDENFYEFIYAGNKIKRSSDSKNSLRDTSIDRSNQCRQYHRKMRKV